MNETHILICGSRGCRKSERACKLMGSSPQQYQQQCENFNTFVSKQMKQRLQQKELFDSIVISYYEDFANKV